MTQDRKRLAFEVAALLVVVVLAVTFMTRRRNETDDAVEHRFAMGTLVSVTVTSPDSGVRSTATAAAFAEVERVEALTTRYSDDSEISRLNERSEGYTAEPVDPDVARVVQTSLEVAESSGGAFDVTVAPLVELWPLDDEDFAPPDETDVAAALAHVDWRAVQVDIDAGTLTVEPGTRLDLAGVAKGHAVDLAAAALERAGVVRGMVDAGGDIRFVGTPPHEDGWYAGIKHPREEGLLGVVRLDGGSVATSGDYQSFVEVDGVRYHHIIDPATGWPARGLVSVTVVSEFCALADALATAVFVMGAERGMALIEGTPGAEAIVATADGEDMGEVLLSSGLEDRFTDTQGWSTHELGRSEVNDPPGGTR